MVSQKRIVSLKSTEVKEFPGSKNFFVFFRFRDKWKAYMDFGLQTKAIIPAYFYTEVYVTKTENKT